MASKGKHSRKRKDMRGNRGKGPSVLKSISDAIWDGQLSAGLLVRLFGRDHEVRRLEQDAEPERRKLLESIIFPLCESLALARTAPGVSQYCELTLKPRMVLISWGQDEDDSVWSTWKSGLLFETENAFEALQRKLQSKDGELLELMGATERETGAVAWVASLAPGKAGAVFLVVVHSPGKEDAFYIADGKEMIGVANGSAIRHAVGFAVMVSSGDGRDGPSDPLDVADDLMSPVYENVLDSIGPAMMALAGSAGVAGSALASQLPVLVEHVMAGVVDKSEEDAEGVRAALAEQIDEFIRPSVNNEMELIRAVSRVVRGAKKQAEQQDARHATEVARLRKRADDDVARWRNLYEKSVERERASASRVLELTRGVVSSPDADAMGGEAQAAGCPADFGRSLGLGLDRLFV